MGKAQYKKRTTEKRHNPIRVPDAHLGGGKEAGQADPRKAEQVLPILAKLKSPEYADRTWACAAVCNLVQNDAATRRLFQSRNVVGELIERLSDSVDEVVVEASGALRNLAIDGGHELCGEMFNKGIMPHLTVLMGKISGTITNLSQPMGDDEASFQARKHLLALAENVVSLLWSLAETSHRTLAAVNGAHPEALLLSILSARASLSSGVVLAAAQAMYSLSQDNAEFRAAVLGLEGGVRVLVDVARTEAAEPKRMGKKAAGKDAAGKDAAEDGEIVEGRATLTRLLACGTIRHLADRADADVVKLTHDVILPLCTSLFDVKLDAVAARVLELVSQVPEQGVAAQGRTDHRSAAETKLERIERMLVTVGVALEVLTGICAGLEDVEADEAAENAEEGMDEDDDEDLLDEALIERGRDPAEPTSQAVGPTVHSLPALSASLPALLVPLALPTSLSFTPPAQPSPHPPTTAALSSLHLRALEALNNLLLTAAAAGAPVPVPGGWGALFDVVARAGAEEATLRSRGQEIRLEVVEAALGCLWGLAKAGQMAPTPAQIQTLADAVPLLTPTSRSRTIDLLALIAARPAVPVAENAAISGWLVDKLEAVSSGPAAAPVSDVVAVLNAVIDIYADEAREYDVVFVQGGYLDQLAGVVAKVRAEVRKIDRRRDAELRARAEEAYENLVAFIKYRRSLRR
ncbi:hypothetical protein Q5752_005097 [Cryptotrichosporon argae]